MLNKFIIKFALICFVVSPPSLAADWQSDNSKSNLQYAASIEQAPINGAFKKFSVSYTVSENGEPIRLKVTVAVASADMGDNDINEVIQSEEWFDTAQFPEAVFLSENFKANVNSGGKNNFVANGTLQLKGIKRPVSVPFNWQRMSDGKASMTGKITLNRADFAIGTGEWASEEPIGLNINVWFDVRLFRSTSTKE